MAANYLIDIVFPVEIQTVDHQHQQQSSGAVAAVAEPVATEEDVKNDNLHLRMVLDGTDRYNLAIWSERDVFFNLTSRITRQSFDTLRREQQLVVGFEGFPAALKKLLVSCLNERVTHAALLVLEGEMASLHIVCKMEHKIVELLSFPLQRLADPELREIVQKRFSELQARLENAETRVAEFQAMYRSGKAPSLFNKHQSNGSHSKTSW